MVSRKDNQLLAGKRDRKITLLRLMDTNDGGDVSEKFQETETISAAAKPLIGQEIWSGNQSLAQADIEFTVLYSSITKTLSTKDRIGYVGAGTKLQQYDIFDITEIGYREGFTIRAKLRDVVNG